MQIKTKIILALALAAAGFGYFQIVGGDDPDAATRSVALMKRSAETMRTVTESRTPPILAAAQR